MARKRYPAEEIIGHLRTIESEMGRGLGLVEACRKLGITEQTYYWWKKEYGGLRVDQAKRLKGLEQENARLKRLVADLFPDNSILKGLIHIPSPPPLPILLHPFIPYLISHPKDGFDNRFGRCVNLLDDPYDGTATGTLGVGGLLRGFWFHALVSLCFKNSSYPRRLPSLPHRSVSGSQNCHDNQRKHSQRS